MLSDVVRLAWLDSKWEYIRVFRDSPDLRVPRLCAALPDDWFTRSAGVLRLATLCL